MRLPMGRCTAGGTAWRTHPSTEAVPPEPAPLSGPPRGRCAMRRALRPVHVGCPSPDPGPHGRTGSVHAPRCIGRDAGPTMVLGRRDDPQRSRHASSPRREHRQTWVVQPPWCTSRQPCRQHTWPEADDARPELQRKRWLFRKCGGSEPTTRMKATVANVLNGAEAAGPPLDPLDLGVRAFDATVGDPLVNVGADLVLPAPYGLHTRQ